MRNWKLIGASHLLLVVAVLWISSASAARISDVRNTKHNFSSTETPNILGNGDQRTVRSQNESEICVFCHTPHGANQTEGPLWNREIPASSSYTVYSSGSIDSSIQQPNGVSKLCLSCHDGSIAIGSVRNAAGSGGVDSTIAMSGTGSGGVMPGGAGSTTGYTRNLGKDLTNDHPISLTYNDAFVFADGEMRQPGTGPLVVRGANGARPGIQDIHLQPVDRSNPSVQTGQVQCISCHDPHIRDTTNDNIKFLRLNRLQKAAPDGNTNNFSTQNDIICLACHTKAGWENSAHAQPAVANELYTNAAADAREFPRGTAVWETACLACHDTHTVSGSRRLLRDGRDGGVISFQGYQIKSGTGGTGPATEETCYACHSPDRGTLQGQGGGNFEVPDIYTEFNLPGANASSMPITTSEQLSPNGVEAHNIGNADGGLAGNSLANLGADLIEGRNNLGRPNLQNRHVECTDCHNPHRVVKRRRFYSTNENGNMDAEGTHWHQNGVVHNNIASGVLRGTWGVEPEYSDPSFHVDPSGFIVKRGEPNSTSDVVTNSYVTREYQVCLKCHSNFAFNEGFNGPPPLRSGTSTTEPGTNGMLRYTNIAREIQAPLNHDGEPRNVGVDGGASTPLGNNGAAWNNNNHRSWHPIRSPTGRTAAARNIGSTAIFNQPFRTLGTQTMYCSDCHGNNTPNGTADPDGDGDGNVNGTPWGPHGSTNVFILKGPWSGARTNGTGEGQPSHLCFKCHNYADYADPNNGAPRDSGFGMGSADGGMGGGGMGGGGGCMGGGGMCGGMGGMGGGGGIMNNLHVFHANQVTNFRCNLCHVAVPHGWKNKVLLVNLNDVGLEVNLSPPREVRTSQATYTRSPYYNRAALKIWRFAESNTWQPGNCGSSGQNGNGATGVAWMAGGSESCQNVP